jgi:hypothetical protein
MVNDRFVGDGVLDVPPENAQHFSEPAELPLRGRVVEDADPYGWCSPDATALVCFLIILKSILFYFYGKISI